MPTQSRFRTFLAFPVGLLISMSGCANKPDTTPQGSQPRSTATGTPIVIGEYGSTTGLTSTFGLSTDHGIEMAVDAINASGGINGHPLKVDLKDDEGKPDEALSVVRLLISQDNVTAILGEVASKSSIAAAPECNSKMVPMISPSSTNVKVTQVGPYIFRACFIDPFQGTAAAKFVMNDLHLKNVAIMTDAANDYSTGLTSAFEKNYTILGGHIVLTQSYTAGDVDFKAQLLAIKAKNPDLLYVPGYYGDVGPMARQAREIGLTIPMMGGDGWDSPKLVEGAGGPGQALEGSYFTDHYAVSNPDPAGKKFVETYKLEYHEDPDALAAMGYDAVGVLADAIKRTGTPANGDFASKQYRSKLRDAIATTKNFQGVTGNITIGPDRNAIKPLVVLQIHGKDFNFVSRVNPD